MGGVLLDCADGNLGVFSKDSVHSVSLNPDANRERKYVLQNESSVLLWSIFCGNKFRLWLFFYLGLNDR